MSDIDELLDQLEIAEAIMIDGKCNEDGLDKVAADKTIVEISGLLLKHGRQSTWKTLCDMREGE